MNDPVSDDLGLFEAIYTQRAIRSFRPDPVPEDLIVRIVEAATKAPSGGNKQPWAFVVVRDPQTRSAMAEHAKVGFGAMYDAAVARMQPGDPEPYPQLKSMIEAFESIPSLVVVCGVGEPGSPAAPWPLAASIYPAVQNLLLAARGLGVGASLTTGWAQKRMPEIRELLALPEHVVPLAFIPLGYPDHARYGSTTRRPVAEVLHWEHYGDKGNTAAFVHR